MADEIILREFSKHWKLPKDEEMKEFIKSIIYRSVLEAKRYVNRCYGENIPEANKIFLEYYQHFTRTDETTPSLSNMYLERTIKEFLDNPSTLFKTYEEVKDVKSFWTKDSIYTYKYTASEKENRRMLAHDIFHNFKAHNGKSFDKESIFSLTGEEKQKLIEYLKNDLSDIRKGLSKTLTTTYIKSIINAVKILNQLGILPEYVKKNNMDRQAMDLEILSFCFEKAENSDRYFVTQLEDEEFLSKLPFEKLVLIYSFYQNRLKKVADTLGMGLFICEKLGDFDISNKELNMDDATRAYLQYTAINELYMDTVPKVYSDLEHYKIEDGYKGKRYVAASFEKIYDEFFAQYDDVYSVYSGGKDKLYDDFSTYFYTQVTEYLQKDFSLETLLLIAIENFEKINWGYIPEFQNGDNSIKRGKENILLGFDVDGFNMPLRLHMPIDKVRSFFKNFSKSNTIPNYIGNEDMLVWNKNMGASILMPLSPKHRKQFISFVKEMGPKNPYYNFARHIQCMQYENNLARIQRWKDPNGRTGVRTYTDLRTGEVIEQVRQK